MEVTVAVIVGKAQFVQTLRTSRESFFSDAETLGMLDEIVHDESRQLALLEGSLERFVRLYSRRAVEVARARLEAILADSAGAYRDALDWFIAGASEGLPRPHRTWQRDRSRIEWEPKWNLPTDRRL